MWTAFLQLALTLWLLLSAATAEAGVLKQLWSGAKHLAGQAFGESAEAVGRKATRFAVKQADDVARVALRSGDDVARLASRFGDDTADICRLISPRNNRRLAMLADDLAASGKAPEVLELIKSGGKADQVVDFLYRNKGMIAGGAAVTMLLTNPDAALAAVSDVTVGVADAVGSHVARPLIENSAEHVVGPVVASMAEVALWGLLCIAITLIVLRRRTLLRDLRLLAGLQKQVWKKQTWKWRRKAGD